MELTINNRRFNFFLGAQVSLKLDSVASVFSFPAYFNPENPEHKELFRPGQFLKAVVTHGGETLITGTLLGNKFRSSSHTDPVAIGGYSLTGVLEDCNVPEDLYPLQADGLSLRNITERILKRFGLKLIVDPAVASRVDRAYTTTTASSSQTIKSFLSELASQRNVIITHDEHGNLLFTEAKTKQTPVFDFRQGMPGVEYELDFNGQQMHSLITVLRQAGMDSENAGQSSANNPYTGGSYRPRVIKQSAGTDNESQYGARNVLSEELRNIKLVITLDRWELGGKLVRPNMMIKVQSPELFLYNSTSFLIEEVTFSGDPDKQVASLSCVLPEVYNLQTPKNIFNV